MNAEEAAGACVFPTAFANFPNVTRLFTASRTHAVHRHGKASIDSLPVELLVSIFRDVIQNSEFYWNPSTLVFVCSHWQNVALLTPEFWIRITVFIDLPFFSTSSIAAAFSRSRKLVLEEVVVTRKTWTVTNDERERERVMSVMPIINLHVHRCTVISFNVLFSSSLPSFPRDFHGTAKHLSSLQLRCGEDDGGAARDMNALAIPNEPLLCPKLRALTIDGRNYFNAYQQNFNWTAMLQAVSTLLISHFSPVDIRSESFTSSDLKNSLFPIRDNLKSLYIHDVHLDESILDDDIDELFNIDFKLELLALTDMHNTRCLTQITGLFGWLPNMHIVRCPLDPRYSCGDKLSLREIDKGEDLVKFLSACRSKELLVDTCPGFGDAVLNAMTILPGAPPWLLRRSDCAPDLRRLHIHNCPDFSVSALKEVIHTRRFRSHLPIALLRLSGFVPDLSAEDREWFKHRVPDFSWDRLVL